MEGTAKEEKGFFGKLKDGKTSIPLNAKDNTDYQEYLAWVAEGNTADAAD